MTFGRSGHQERTSYRARTPTEVQQIQRGASPARIYFGHQQVPRRNCQAHPGAGGCDAQDSHYLRSRKQQCQGRTHQQQSDLDGESEAPPGHQYARKRHSQSRSQILSCK